MMKKVAVVLYLSQLLAGCMQQDDAQEGLDASAHEALGGVLAVKTAYGWGWVNPDSTDPIPVADFNMRLESLWSYQGILRGGTGTVVSEGHPLYGNWVVFTTRHKAHYDFVKHVGHYNLSIGNSKPAPNDTGWPIFPTGEIRSGYGEVRLAR